MRAAAKIFISVTIIIGLLIPAASYSDSSGGRPIKYVRGRIYKIDYPGSKITIKWFYGTGKLSEDKITFYVGDNVRVLTDRDRIFKSVRQTGLADLIERDHVVVTYYDDKKRGNPEAISIRILEHDKPTPP